MLYAALGITGCITIGIIYFIIGLIVATVWGVNNIPKDGDSEDYIMAFFPVFVLICLWIIFTPLIPIYIINKLRR